MVKYVLSSTVNNINDVDEFQVQLSSDGSLAYIGRAQIPGIAGSVADDAQTLYKNNNGVLTKITGTTLDEVRSKHPDYLLSVAIASPDFTLFALLVIPPLTESTTPISGTAYVMFYTLQDNTFVFQKEFAINNFLANFPYLNIGKESFTKDNKYLVYSYCPYKPTFTEIPGVVEVLDIENLLVTSQQTIYSFCIGANFFEYGNDTYLACGSGQMVGSNFLFTKFIAAKLDIYKLASDGTLSLVTSLPQPQQITSVTINKRPSFFPPTIAVTMTLALDEGEESIYNLSQSIASTKTFIPGESDNLRFYTFNDDKLKLVYSEHFDSNINSSTWRDTNTLALIIQEGAVNLANAGLPMGSTFSSVTIPNTLVICSLYFALNFLGTVSLPTPVPPLALVDFSADGEWMFVGGAGLPYPSALNTTALYKLQK